MNQRLENSLHVEEILQAPGRGPTFGLKGILGLVVCFVTVTGCSCNSVGYTRFDASSRPSPDHRYAEFWSRLELVGLGDGDDAAWVEKELEVPAGTSSTHISAYVTMGSTHVQLWGEPLWSYVTGGAWLALEVREGEHVLCRQERELLRRWIHGGEESQGLSEPIWVLQCRFAATRVGGTRVRARVIFNTWGSVWGGINWNPALVRVVGGGTVDEIREKHCPV